MRGTKTIEDRLLEQLQSIPAGKDGWKEYENLVYKILDHLFCTYKDPERRLEYSKIQDRTSHSSKIRDAVMDNFATKGFWRKVADRYKGDHIVFEFKNYTNSIKAEQILQTANYLTEIGCGLLGFIWTRQDINSSATQEIKYQWIYQGKMIICLNDTDIKLMLEEKKAGREPELIIKNKISELRRGLD